MYLGLGYSKRIVPSNQNQLGIDPNNFESAGLETDPDSIQILTNTPASPEEEEDLGTRNIATISPNFQNFHYFEMPLLIQYQISPRFSLELGGKIGRLYGYRHLVFDESDAIINVLSTSTEPELVSVFQKNNEDNTIPKWNTGLLGGFAFKLTPKLQTYSNFHYGLNNYFTPKPESEASAKKWRQIEVGIRYYFK